MRDGGNAKDREMEPRTAQKTRTRIIMNLTESQSHREEKQELLNYFLVSHFYFLIDYASCCLLLSDATHVFGN